MATVIAIFYCVKQNGLAYQETDTNALFTKLVITVIKIDERKLETAPTYLIIIPINFLK